MCLQRVPFDGSQKYTLVLDFKQFFLECFIMHPSKFLYAILSFFLGVTGGTQCMANDFFYPSDVNESQYKAALEYLYDQKIMQGYDDGTLKPDQLVNRAEFLKILMASKGVEPDGENCFPDVDTQWFAEYVCKGKELGLIRGYPDGLFRPEQPVNFVEAAQMIFPDVTLEDVEDNYLEASSDAPNPEYWNDVTTPWYRPAVLMLENKQAIPFEVNSFSQLLRRGEVADIFFKLEVNPDVTTNSYDRILAMDPHLSTEEKDSFSPRRYLTYGPEYSEFPYYKDSKYVYYSDASGKLVMLEGADAETFEEWNPMGGFFSDQHSVYSINTVAPLVISKVEGASPDTFQQNYQLFFDEHSLYTLSSDGTHKPLPDFEISSMENYDGTNFIPMFSDIQGIVYPIFKDGKFFYVYDFQSQKLLKFTEFNRDEFIKKTNSSIWKRIYNEV